MVQFSYVLYLPIYVLFCHFILFMHIAWLCKRQANYKCHPKLNMHPVRLKFHDHIIIHSSHFTSTGGAQRLQAQYFSISLQVTSDLAN